MGEERLFFGQKSQERAHITFGNSRAWIGQDAATSGKQVLSNKLQQNPPPMDMRLVCSSKSLAYVQILRFLRSII